VGKVNSFVRVAALSAGAVCSGSSLADQGVLGQYQDLAATFDASSGVLEIFAADMSGWQSAGFVRQMGGAGLSAVFSPGFVSAPNPASFSASLVVTNIGDGFAEASGEVVITDVDGDTLTMGVDRHALVFGHGDASVLGITLWVALSSDEGLFDGSDGGQVPTDFALDSAVLSLFIQRDPREGSGLFHSSFSDGRASALFAIPAPGGAGVLGLAGVVLARRRRRGG